MPARDRVGDKFVLTVRINEDGRPDTVVALDAVVLRRSGAAKHNKWIVQAHFRFPPVPPPRRAAHLHSDLCERAAQDVAKTYNEREMTAEEIDDEVAMNKAVAARLSSGGGGGRGDAEGATPGTASRAPADDDYCPVVAVVASTSKCRSGFGAGNKVVDENIVVEKPCAPRPERSRPRAAPPAVHRRPPHNPARRARAGALGRWKAKLIASAESEPPPDWRRFKKTLSSSLQRSLSCPGYNVKILSVDGVGCIEKPPGAKGAAKPVFMSFIAIKSVVDVLCVAAPLPRPSTLDPSPLDPSPLPPRPRRRARAVPPLAHPSPRSPLLPPSEQERRHEEARDRLRI